MPTDRTSPPPAPGPKLFDQIRTAINRRPYSPRTAEAYVAWARRYIVFHGKRHPRERGVAEVMGQTIATAQRYTHLAGAHQADAHRDLAAAAPVTDLVAVGTILGTPGDPNTLDQAAIRRIPKRMRRATAQAKSRVRK